MHWWVAAFQRPSVRWLAWALGLLLVLNLMLYGRQHGFLSPLKGQPAPALDLQLLGGGRFSLASGANRRVTVISFWATWCPPCREELPALDRVWRRYREWGVDLVAVNVESAAARASVAAFVERAHLELPIALDGEAAMARYRVDSLPHLVVVDASGRVRVVLVGPQSEAELGDAIDRTLSLGN